MMHEATVNSFVVYVVIATKNRPKEPIMVFWPEHFGFLPLTTFLGWVFLACKGIAICKLLHNTFVKEIDRIT